MPAMVSLAAPRCQEHAHHGRHSGKRQPVSLRKAVAGGVAGFVEPVVDVAGLDVVAKARSKDTGAVDAHELIALLGTGRIEGAALRSLWRKPVDGQQAPAIALFSKGNDRSVEPNGDEFFSAIAVDVSTGQRGGADWAEVEGICGQRAASDAQQRAVVLRRPQDTSHATHERRRRRDGDWVGSRRAHTAKQHLVGAEVQRRLHTFSEAANELSNHHAGGVADLFDDEVDRVAAERERFAGRRA
ncbi:hypothetical protein DAPPUDRAFT_272981 [Daphnia pulex]|uniref:Uncharacterized protein n=1 Tax=Daphnia pulex TaxID=6669 RepID=E9I3B5_DAPPU|nr:hypothetical protein DAPPUDRAFT_272981 [Daphnia pulex]|eukprot:EFX61514.1 hypothetical protein DAPPUDRAFT_272981 [Daphnia pulex]